MNLLLQRELNKNVRWTILMVLSFKNVKHVLLSSRMECWCHERIHVLTPHNAILPLPKSRSRIHPLDLVDHL